MSDLPGFAPECPFPLGHPMRAVWFYQRGDCADHGSQERRA